MSKRPDDVSEEELSPLVIAALASALHWAYEVDEVNLAGAEALRTKVAAARSAHDKLVASCRALRDRNAKLEAVAEAAERMRRKAGFVCTGDCLTGVKVDEDECCVTCGSDCYVWQPTDGLDDALVAAGYSPTEGGGA